MELNGAVLIGLFLFSIAMLWAIRIVYGPIRSEDSVRRALTIGGISLSAISLTGIMMALMSSFIGINIIVAALIVTVTIVVLALARHHFFEAERRSYLWMLSHAIERELPLVEVAKAFRSDRVFLTQCDQVTDRISQGASLPEAMRSAGFPLNVDTYLALHVSRLTKQLGLAIKTFTVEHDEVDSLLRVLFTRLCYFLALVVYWSLVTTFLMLKIVPVYSLMFRSFALELPLISQTLIKISDRYSGLLVLILLPTMLLSSVALVITLLKSLDLLGRDLPLLGRLGFGLDRARVMRSLALTVRSSTEIDKAMRFLALNYPKGFVAAKLRSANTMTNVGQHWCDALHRVNLIGKADVAVLKSAERAGNLAWALEEMANNQARRFIYRLRWVQSVVFPIVTLAFGTVAAFFVIALFQPLIMLISGLT